MQLFTATFVKNKCLFLTILLEKNLPSYEFLVVVGQVRVWDRKRAGWGGRGLAWSAGWVRIRSVRVRGGSGQDFSNSCGCGASLNFAGAGRERTKNFNPRRTLVYVMSCSLSGLCHWGEKFVFSGGYHPTLLLVWAFSPYCVRAVIFTGDMDFT